jgi:SAM-dependent methyltransferase
VNEKFPKANQYPDLEEIYAQCSGPGALELAEFLAEKMGVSPGTRLLDVGFNRGYQTCFLAKNYSLQVVGIDPGNDRADKRPHVDHLMDNARVWGVANQVLGIAVGVPDTKIAAQTFDYVYSTSALEMLRGIHGEAVYLASLREILRLLKPGGVFALAEPMHLDVPVPDDLAPRVAKGPQAWTQFFTTIDNTRSLVADSGFEVLEAAYAPDARRWWEEYAAFDPFSRQDPQGEALTIRLDGGRWLSFGFVIARKPA